MSKVIEYDPSGEPSAHASGLVICVRYPDESNSFVAWYRNAPNDNGRTSVHDIDMGYADLDDPDEFVDWANSHTAAAAQLAAEGWIDACNYIEELVDRTAKRNGHEE